jgi:predicted MFS family arabinose efflux permease
MENLLPTRVANPRARWMTLAAGVIGSAISSGVISIVVFGMTLKQIATEFGWYRSQVSVGLVCFYLFNGAGALILGHLTARLGVRWPAVVFVLGFASANLMLALIPASMPLFALVFVWLGLSSGGCTSMPYAIGIAGWFDKGRGLALAVAVSGTGLGHLFLPSFVRWRISAAGWRGAYDGVAVYVAIVGLFALLALYREPPLRQRQLTIQPSGFLSIYKKHRAVGILAIAIFLLSFASIGLSVSLPALVTDAGFSTSDAAAILTVYGAANWIAKLATGPFLDRFHVRFVAAGIFLLVASAGVVLLTYPRLIGMYIAASLIGCGVGAEADIMTYGASRYHEPSGLGKAVGAIWVWMPWGAGLGVLAGTASFDLCGNYRIAVLAYTISAIGATAVIMWLGPYRDRIDA